jgi:hypothetical protein
VVGGRVKIAAVMSPVIASPCWARSVGQQAKKNKGAIARSTHKDLL